MKKAILLFICLFSSAITAACSQSGESRNAQSTQIAAEIFATQTAGAPTFTSTSAPTPTSTSTSTSTVTPIPTIKPSSTSRPTPTSTFTPNPTPTIAPTTPPLPEGWRGYTASGFYVT
ncbi:MAG: hypothetical protein JXA42_22235, partial [Anaerolineales bacterium]|nr:hypothetical protein [Anaerolineales bacterium]